MATVADHVVATIDSWEQDKLDFAVLHACIAVDATARHTYPDEGSVGARFRRFLRERHWLLEPTAMPGFDLDQSRFGNVQLRNKERPDWADVIYEVFRCNHTHGDQVPPGFKLVPGVGLSTKTGVIGEGVLEMPDNLPFGLLFAVVLAPVNTDEVVPDHYRLTLGHQDLGNFMQFPINDWWGAEADFVAIARRHNKVRVNFQF